MHIWSDSFEDGQPLPARLAFGRPDVASKVAWADNRNPHLAWADVPEGARSLALICHDPDVPSKGGDVNQPGRVVPAELPRVDFFHWVLIDLPPTLDAIAEGEFAQDVQPRGKPGPTLPAALASKLGPVRQGINDFTGWFAGDAAMAGDYHGYDGPCPPWNDAMVHRYLFTVYALDVPTLSVPARFTGADVRAAMRGHILAQASVGGLYTLNPGLLPSVG